MYLYLLAQGWLGPAVGGGSIPPPAHLPDPLVCQFIPMIGHDDYSYHEHLSQAWDTDAVIVNVEWDMQYSLDLMAELLACPHPLCTHAYQMHIPRTYYAHSTRADAMDGFWIGHGDEWAAYSGIGFCKIAPEARTGPLGRTVWRGLEFMVNAATRRDDDCQRKWHVHWPGVEHFHKEGRGRNAQA